MTGIPAYEQCRNTLNRYNEHIAIEEHVNYRDGWYHASCYFCGQPITSSGYTDKWHPVHTYLIREEVQLEDLYAVDG